MPRDAWPQQGIYPTDGVQCGPYTANEWAGWMSTGQRAGGMVRTGAASPPGLPATPLKPNIGVYYHIPNQLEVTEAPANQINIDTGAWLCDGRFGFNDTQITGIVPAVGPRTDYVIVRQNYSGADFTTGPAGAALTVEANTCNVTIINSANFTQDQDRATYWDIPLASYDIDAGGVITNVTDLREWVDAEVKKILLPGLNGYDSTGGNIVDPDDAQGILHANGQTTISLGFWVVPNNFIGPDITITPIFVGDNNVGPNNIWIDPHQVIWSTCGETWILHGGAGAAIYTGAAPISDSTGFQGNHECLTAAQLTAAAPTIDDFLHCYIRTIRGHANDTYIGDVYFVGFLLEYLGWGRK